MFWWAGSPELGLHHEHKRFADTILQHEGTKKLPVTCTIVVRVTGSRFVNLQTWQTTSSLLKQTMYTPRANDASWTGCGYDQGLQISEIPDSWRCLTMKMLKGLAVDEGKQVVKIWMFKSRRGESYLSFENLLCPCWFANAGLVGSKKSCQSLHPHKTALIP